MGDAGREERALFSGKIYDKGKPTWFGSKLFCPHLICSLVCPVARLHDDIRAFHTVLNGEYFQHYLTTMHGTK